MSRSVNQAIYKYLPGSWGDFYDSDSRIAYTMQISRWNSDKLEGVNKKRILNEVKNEIKQFVNRGGKILGFGSLAQDSFSLDEYNILTPKCSDDVEVPDIITNVSPLTFACSKCHGVTTFKNSREYLQYPKNRKCQKNNCGGELKQIGLVYACTCGWASPVKANWCYNKEHANKHLKYSSGEFKYTCTLDGRSIEMIAICKDCNQRIFPKNISSGDIFIPFNFTIIELLNSQEENFLIEKDEAPFIVIANWLDKIDSNEYSKLVKATMNEDSTNADDLYQLYLSQMISNGLSEEQAKPIAQNMALQNDPNANRRSIIQEIKTKLDGDFVNTEYGLRKLAISLVEYKTIVDSDVKITIDQGIDMAMAQNAIFSPDEYYNIFDKFGFSRIEACGNIPLLNCVYGFTRRESDPKGLAGDRLTLRGLKEERPGVKNIYGVKLNTEGILFELDRAKVISWMIQNGILDENLAPDLNDEEALKLWFLNNINLEAITTFSSIDAQTYKYTSYVYNLVHSIAHALIKDSEDYSGLDKNSLGEYLFPNVPGFFIYCQNSQGTSLGSMFSLYTSVLNKWISRAAESVNKCVFDPICIDRDRACLGCLYINEISCKHFNKDLDRRYLIGYTDVITNNRIYGYWED